MIRLSITDKNLFYNKLFDSEAFDSFAFIEATIRQDILYILDGVRIGSTKKEEEPSSSSLNDTNYINWKEIKKQCNQIMDDKDKLHSFQIVLHTSHSYLNKLLEKNQLEPHLSPVKDLTLTIRYQEDILQCITGVNYNTFVLDKSIDKLWDITLKKSFSAMNVPFNED